jgi:hypothetical protein
MRKTIAKEGVPDFGTLPYSINPAKAHRCLGWRKPLAHPLWRPPKKSIL